MAYENIILEKKGYIGVLTLNRPPANSVNLATLEEIDRALDDLENDKGIRVVIITGAGEKGFSAGFDVSDAANADKVGPKGQRVQRSASRNSISALFRAGEAHSECPASWERQKPSNLSCSASD